MNRVQKPVEEIDELCPDCGRNLVIRTGRFGRFISCSGFPDCRYRRSFMNKTGALCPVCGGDLVERKTKQKKRIFYGCSNYPTCNFAIWERPVADPCPRCGGLMVVPKAGQDPVCYTEVVAVQKSAEEKPQQDGTARTKRAAKSTSGSKIGEGTTTRKARSTTSTGRAKKTTARASSAKKKTSTRAAASKSTSRSKSATTKKTATSRTRSVKTT